MSPELPGIAPGIAELDGLSRCLPRGDAEEGHPRSEDKLARRNGETSAAGPRGVMECEENVCFS